jgi:hypothetical protein
LCTIHPGEKRMERHARGDRLSLYFGNHKQAC